MSGPRLGELENRLVTPEHVAHRAADLAERAAVAERVVDPGQQVLGAARGRAELFEAAPDELLVAIGLERRQSLHLLALGFGIDAQEVDVERFTDAVGV